MAKKKEMTSKDYYKLDKLSRKKLAIKEHNFIEAYGHLKTNQFLPPTYNLNEGIAIWEPVNSLVTFIVELEK